MNKLDDIHLDYTPADIAGLHLRASTTLKSLTRKEFLSRLQLIRELEPIVEKAWKEAEEKIWREDLDTGHGDYRWNTSFHGSQFPGDQAMACGRQAMYRMMDFAPEQPFTRRSRTLMDIGKAMEVTLVNSFYKAGILLSAPPDSAVQTQYIDSEHWFSATTDAVILPPRWNKPLPIEIKTKDRKTVEKMNVGAVGPDEAHIRQCKVEIAIVRILQRTLWPSLELADHGILYYMARGDKKKERTVLTAEFRVDYDQKFWIEGLKTLKRWQKHFLDGELPHDPQYFGKRHPFGWRWSYQPCVWCNYGKECRDDHKAKQTDLLKSAGIERTKRIRPDYDPEETRQHVKSRWHVE